MQTSLADLKSQDNKILSGSSVSATNCSCINYQSSKNAKHYILFHFNRKRNQPSLFTDSADEVCATPQFDGRSQAYPAGPWTGHRPPSRISRPPANTISS
jgi:hypothetical protein